MIDLVFAVVIAHADVLISAGHEGRPQSCARFPKRACNLGAEGERQWTPIVADEATRVLRARGITVAREPADFDGQYDVAAAVFIHFDGSEPVCSSAASIGYHDADVRPVANLWRTIYGHYFPFGFQPDNFTDGLRNYYGYRQVHAQRGALVLELGEVTCPAQRRWLAPRLREEGDIIAHFLSAAIGKGDVPEPARR